MRKAIALGTALCLLVVAAACGAKDDSAAGHVRRPR